MTHQIATANRLDNGRVVYLAPSGQWVGALSEAEVARDASAAAALIARAEAAVIDNLIVGPVLISVLAASGLPQRLRERIRGQGPTVLAAGGHERAA